MKRRKRSLRRRIPLQRSSMEDLWLNLATVAFAGGAAWGGVKISLNGIKGDVRELKDDVRSMRKLPERLSAVETELRLLRRN